MTPDFDLIPQRIKLKTAETELRVFNRDQAVGFLEILQVTHDRDLRYRLDGKDLTPPKREFFRINPERVLSILKLVEVRDVTLQ